MTEEEKEAIEILKKVKNEKPFVFWFAGECYNKKSIFDTVLNLIEKQQKEIEELKDKNKSIVYNYEMVVDKLENSTLNDKIKAKIEEVEQWELYNMKIPRLSTLDERLGAKIGIKYVLQSLLEKE